MLRSITLVTFVAVLVSRGEGPPGALPEQTTRQGPLFTCGGPTFPASALTRSTGAENRTDPASRGLHRFVHAPENFPPAEFPLRNWRVLVKRQDLVLFGHGREGHVDRTALFTRRAGSWSFETGGDCSPKLALPGREVVRWRLERKPSRSDRVLHIRADTGTCDLEHPGRDIRRRFERVHIEQRRRAFRLVVVLRDREPEACAGVGWEHPLEVRLPAPLGGRALFDAGTTPAKRIRRPDIPLEATTGIEPV